MHGDKNENSNIWLMFIISVRLGFLGQERGELGLGRSVLELSSSSITNIQAKDLPSKDE